MLTPIISIALVCQTAAPITVSKLRTMQGMNALSYVAAPTGAKFAASLEDMSVKVIDAPTGKVLANLKGHPFPVYGLAYNKTGTTLATGDESGRIYLWDAKTNQKVKEFSRVNAHTRGIQCLSFSPDGKTLASTGKDDIIIFWDIASGKQIGRLFGKGAIFTWGSYTPNGGFYASTLMKGVHVYNPKNLTLARTFDQNRQGINEFSLSLVGTKAVTGGKDMSLGIWDLSGNKRTGLMKGHEDWIMHTAISPNGRLAASSANDRKVIVWDLASAKQICCLEGQSAIGAPLVITADGKYLVSSNLSDHIQINQITPPQAEKPTSPPKKRPAAKRKR